MASCQFCAIHQETVRLLQGVIKEKESQIERAQHKSMQKIGVKPDDGIDELRLKIEALERENNTLREQLHDQNTEIGRLRNDTAKVAEERADLVNKVQGLTRDQQNMHKERDDLVTGHDRLTRQYSILLENNQGLETQRDRLWKHNKDLLYKTEDLRKQLTSAKSLASRSESLPLTDSNDQLSLHQKRRWTGDDPVVESVTEPVSGTQVLIKPELTSSAVKQKTGRFSWTRPDLDRKPSMQTPLTAAFRVSPLGPAPSLPQFLGQSGLVPELSGISLNKDGKKEIVKFSPQRFQALFFKSVGATKVKESWGKFNKLDQCISCVSRNMAVVWILSDAQEQRPACLHCTMLGNLCMYVDGKAIRTRALHYQLRSECNVESDDFWILPIEKKSR